MRMTGGGLRTTGTGGVNGVTSNEPGMKVRRGDSVVIPAAGADDVPSADGSTMAAGEFGSTGAGAAGSSACKFTPSTHTTKTTLGSFIVLRSDRSRQLVESFPQKMRSSQIFTLG